MKRNGISLLSFVVGRNNGANTLEVIAHKSKENKCNQHRTIRDVAASSEISCFLVVIVSASVELDHVNLWLIRRERGEIEFLFWFFFTIWQVIFCSFRIVRIRQFDFHSYIKIAVFCIQKMELKNAPVANELFCFTNLFFSFHATNTFEGRKNERETRKWFVELLQHLKC